MYSFGETNNTIYGGGGSGGGVRWNSGNWASGVYGYIGGGYGGLYSSGFYAGGNGHINTCGGGGGGAYEYNYPADTGHPGGLGGTGIIIVRWGY
ncbi:hypothetical protein SDC9_166551 [bioreactor metagenome]|uniref:Uncharacterized protein n=1 Tax=bioreactor metagenome TaxID=1076179 RepID=A0A645FXK9_9ZZZZ